MFIKCSALVLSRSQGSVLGPLLFTLYSSPLNSLNHSHKLDHHLYVDDTQVYISLSTVDTDISLKNLVAVSMISLAGWQTINLGSILTKRIQL